MPFDVDPTASSCERGAECPASFALAQVTESGEDADRGTEIHLFTKRVVTGADRKQALESVSEPWRSTCDKLEVHKLVQGLERVRCEVAFAWDTEKSEARELGVDLGRRYGPRPLHIIPGSIDLHGFRTYDGAPVTLDIKTGLSVGAVADHWQSRFHANSASFLAKADVAEGRIAYVREDGKVWIEEHEFQVKDFDEIEEDLAELVRGVREARAMLAETGRVHVARGDWCKYCPAFAACPGHILLARAMLEEVEAIAGKLEAMTPEEGGRAWEKMSDAYTILDNVWESMKGLAHRWPLPLPNGKEVRPVPWSSTSFDKEGALILLRKKGATESEIEALTRRTKTEQVRAVNPPGTKRRRGRSERAA